MVSTTKQIWALVGAQVLHTPKRHRSGQKTLVRSRLVLPLKCVDAAPVAVRARFGDEGTVIEWRAFEGALWRPVIDGDGRPMTGQTPDFADETWLRERPGNWLDNPFGGGLCPEAAEHPAHCLTDDDVPTDRREVDHTQRVHAAAAAMAENDLLEIGGVLHRRSPGPVWAIGSGAVGSLSPGRVKLHVPDLRSSPCFLAMVGPDAVDVAMAAQARYADLLEEAVGERRDGAWDGQIVDAVEILDPDLMPDATAMSITHAIDALEMDMSPLNFERCPFPFMAAYVDLVRTARQQGDGIDRLPEIATRVDALLDAAGDTFKEWPRMDDALLRIRALKALEETLSPMQELSGLRL